MSLRYHNPVAIRFGGGATGELREVLGGRRTVLITFREAAGLGLVDRLRRIIGDGLISIEDQIDPNPDVVAIAALYQRFWRDHAQCEAVLAVGGGSVIDTAKALVVGTASGRFDELVALHSKGAHFKPARVKALVAMPTTAGTGSEVTPWATIWDRATARKHSLHLRQMWPETALIDPDLMLTLPPAITLQSALDALSHALEAIWNVNANPISDTYAVAAAREVIDILPELLASPSSPLLRKRMALAALKAGMAFSNTKTALAHSISYDMTLRFGLAHGIACSFTLPMVLERAIGIDPERDAVLQAVFSGALIDAPELLAAFLQRVGVATEFEAYGVAAQEAQTMVRHALKGERGRNFIGKADQWTGWRP